MGGLIKNGKEGVLQIALIFAIVGLVVSRPWFLEWLSSMSSLQVMLAYYAMLAGAFYVIVGRLVGRKTLTWRNVLAFIMIWWAFCIVLNFFPISSYSQVITGAQLSNIELASEEQMTIEFLKYLGVVDVPTQGVLTYCIIPLIMTIVAGWYVAPNTFHKIFARVMG